MRLWQYMKEKMRPFSDRIAFANAKLTYKDLLGWDKQACADKHFRICDSQTRELQAIEIIRCIAESDVAVPVAKEYGVQNYSYVKQKIEETQEQTQDLAFLMFTSGTTGNPKGVMLTDENIVCNLEYIFSYFYITDYRKICIGRPLAHIAVIVGELLYALCNGLTIYFYEESFMPQRALEYFIHNEIDVFCATPTLYYALAKVRGDREFPIKTGAISGEILSEKAGRYIAEIFPDTRFYNVYGLTEHSPRVSALPSELFATRPHSIGKPIGNVKVKIEDGELLVSSPCIMKGYLDDKEQTNRKIRDGWLYTGDAAHFDADGYLYIDGRKDNMIIRAGLNIYPEEIELRVKEYADVEDCVVYGEEAAIGKILCLEYVGLAEPNMLKKRLAAALNPHIMPNRIIKTNCLRKTANGKKVRRCGKRS